MHIVKIGFADNRNSLSTIPLQHTGGELRAVVKTVFCFLFFQQLRRTALKRYPQDIHLHLFTSTDCPLYSQTLDSSKFLKLDRSDLNEILVECKIDSRSITTRIVPALMISSSKPLTISSIHRSESGGRLLLCQAPGKNITRGRDGRCYSRSLVTDVHQFKSAGVVCIICLLNPSELRSLGIDPREYPSVCSHLQIQLVQYPMIEMAPPEDIHSFETEVVQRIVSYLSVGESVLVHCRGGIGRSGLVAACVLLSLGIVDTANSAIEKVRKARDKRCVESHKQEDFVAFYLHDVIGPRH